MPYQTIFLGRYPPPKDLLGRTFYALGSLLRATGGALDAVGTAVQGGYAGKDARRCRAEQCIVRDERLR
jgi:hypothetical protein